MKNPKRIDWEAGAIALGLILALGFLGAMAEPVFKVVDAVVDFIDPPLEQK